jgi:asparagine N-glycosylation enzyme membrane subunit Stt3
MLEISKKKAFWVLIGIILLGIIIRLFVFNTVTTGHSQDEYWFMTLGKGFIENFNFELISGEPYDLSQPLHPFLIGIFSLFLKDLFFTGKIISLIFGILMILFTYIFWSKMKDKQTGLLASFFVAFAALSIKYSIAIREDSLYTALLIITLFFIYKIKNEKFMPIAGIFIVLCALTRWEGYLLIPVVFAGFLIYNWKKMFTKKGLDISPIKNKYFLLSVLIILIPLFLWSFRSYTCCGSWIPSYGYQQQLGGGSAGFSYLKDIPVFVPWYFLIFIAIGLFYSFKNYKKYSIIYLYLILSLIIHMKFRGHSDQVLYVTPILYGFMSILILKIKKRIEKRNIPVGRILFIAFIGFFMVIGAVHGYNTTKEWGGRNDVIKEAMDWFNENSEPEDKILAGDKIVYSYFTDREIYNYGYAYAWINKLFLKQNPVIEPEDIISYPAFLASNDVKYFVAYDSTMSWFYTQTEGFAKQFQAASFYFSGKRIDLIPLKRFKVNNEEIILFKMEEHETD